MPSRLDDTNVGLEGLVSKRLKKKFLRVDLTNVSKDNFECRIPNVEYWFETHNSTFVIRKSKLG